MTPQLKRPPSSFPIINTHALKAGTVLHRNHARAFGPISFNPCQGQPSRFAPFDDEHDRCVPTLYAASSREAAAFESVFHDIAADAPFKTVPQYVVESRLVSRITPRRDLCLAALFAPDLKAWGLRRADFIDTPKSTYDQSVLWARAVYNASHAVEGLVWTSVQCDPAQCVVLFGTRVLELDFEIVDCVKASDPAVLLEMRAYGKRSGIALVS